MNSKKIHALIPSRFTITDASFKSRKIEFGSDKNESFKSGQSSTQNCRSYSFETDDLIIRLIDTPGVGDTRGVTKDEENFENLLVYLGEFTEINAIVIMLKPNDSRLTVLFEYCIKQLLSSLERSAIDNIVFLFANARATFYNPGDTVEPLQELLKEIKETPPNMEIPFKQENTFCLDNEAFRYLLAKREGLDFADHIKQSFANSWDNSVMATKRFLKYVSKLTPHKIQNTISVMEARRSIERLRKPLGEIAVLIENNLSRINRLETNLNDTTKSIDDLKPFLFVPRINLKLKECPSPITVCTNAKCTEAHIISDVTSYHYKQICHDECYLEGVPKNVTGDPRLQDCAIMVYKDNKWVCKWKKCGHNYLEHMHVYYLTEPYEEKIKDLQIQTKLTTKEAERDLIQKELKRYQVEKEEFEAEKDIIQKAVAKFAHFLSNSVIIPYNDAYKEYLHYLIEKEKKLGDLSKRDVIQNYEELITRYEMEKEVLMEELRKVQVYDSSVRSVVKAPEIMNIVKKLYDLKFSGKMIKQMYEAQRKHVENEIVKSTEKVVKPIEVKNSDGTVITNYFKYVVGSILKSN
nr:uncharacterized protein LOC111416866 isoform X1 [Onthophagus taurus]XP_022904738.1 uncharacterized protein LOC111416866 isoform X2 [Onthophagus taurus]